MTTNTEDFETAWVSGDMEAAKGIVLSLEAKIARLQAVVAEEDKNNRDGKFPTYDELECSLRAVTQERDDVRDERDAAIGDAVYARNLRDDAQRDSREYEKVSEVLTRENSQLATQVDVVMRERDELAAQLRAMTQDRNALVAQVETMREERDGLATELATEHNTYGTLSAKNDAHIAKVNQLLTENGEIRDGLAQRDDDVLRLVTRVSHLCTAVGELAQAVRA